MSIEMISVVRRFATRGSMLAIVANDGRLTTVQTFRVIDEIVKAKLQSNPDDKATLGQVFDWLCDHCQD